ncbi:MAG: hypothetical protein IJZ90_01100 [Clostridia bacterium]|nr:hypothetical protein [Clostridia bacterium]
MKNKTKKYIIIAVVIVAYIAVSVTVSVLLRKEQGALEPGVVMYGLSSGITDSVSYLSEDESVSPVFVSNGVNNSVYYTAPSLNTGCITESYTDDYTADSAPAMVIGEGHHKDNYTIVRVLNEQQVCVNQFLAFSPEVVGGVAVAAGDTVIGEKSVTLIATAAYEVLCDAAKTIRVFDCNGMLYMEITPEFYENAPYIIATGHFVENDSNEYLFVASSSVENGKIEAAVYSLSDGSVVKELSYDFGSEHNGKEVVMGVRNKENSSDSFIFLVLGEVIEEVEDDEDYEVPEYCDTHAVFEGNVSGGISQSDIMVPSYANGIYQSANEFEQYVITVDSELYSFIYTYTYGEKEGTKLNVDYEDSGFYWSVDDEYLDIIDLEDFEETYVRYTEVRNLNADEPEVQEETDDFMSHFTYWSVTLSEYNLYPARNAYTHLASAYEKNPSNIVAVELFSGSDILKDITADNNAKEVMESFKNYMISFYGSIENINEYFYTAFDS